MSQEFMKNPARPRIRKWMIAIMGALVLLIAVLAADIVLNSNEVYNRLFSSEKLDKTFEFKTPYLVTSDSKNNIYLVDNKSKRLTKLSPKGDVLFTLDGGKREKGTFYLLLNTAIDEKDYLYVEHVIVDMVDSYPTTYEIQRYTPEGVYDRTIVSYTRTKQEKSDGDGEFLGNIQVSDGYVHFVLYKLNKGSQFFRHKVDGQGESELVLTMPGKANFISMVGTKPGAIYLTKLDGKIYSVNDGGVMVPTLASQKPIIAPWGLQIDKDGQLYVSDVLQQAFYKVGINKAINSIVNIDTLRAQKYQASNLVFRYFSLSRGGDFTVVDEVNSAILVFDSEGRLKTTLKKATLSSELIGKELRYRVEMVLAALMVLALIIVFYIEVLKRRLQLVVKQLLIFIPVVALAIIITALQIYQIMYQRQLKSYYDQAAFIAQIGSQKIDGDALERLQEPKDFNTADYEKVRQQMRMVFNDNQDPWNAAPYARIYTFRNGLCYITVDWSARYGVVYPFTYAQPEHKAAFIDGKIGFTRYQDFDSDLIVGVAPIRNKANRIVGIFEVMIDYYNLGEVQKEFFKTLRVYLIVSIFAFVLVFSVLTFFILLALGKLRNALIEVSGGKWDTSINIRSRDEIEDLGTGFNLMAGQIRQYITDITNLNRVYVKFVPSEFLEFLGKKSILEIQLGDQVQKDMSVLFTDIRSFTSLSESMTPTENFNFINAYLRRMGPVIRNNKGFIDKYIGDAIMALFAGDAENSVKAGVQMKVALMEYNKKRVKDGHAPIAIGVGIHTGSLMLGTVGEEERMNGTVISDNVNLASRLEGLTKMYGAGIIISESTFRQIPSDKYHYRFLDKVRVKGKSEPVSIYEILDGEPKEDFDLKIQTLPLFTKALQEYLAGNFANAAPLFNQVLQANSHDKACMLFSKRCEKYMKIGKPADWDGAEHLDEK